MKSILITGGAGFIGSEFSRQAVRKGHHVIVADTLTYAGDGERLKEVEKEITFYQADITDREGMDRIFRTERPDSVVHWAAESHVDRSILDATPFLETNVKGTQVLLDLARRHGIERFVNISTDEVYGDLSETGQFVEDSPLLPNSPYSVSKASADMLGRAYFKTFGLPVVTVRPSNNYGPWQYPEKLIPVVILKALNNENIPVYGTGQNVREWLYVSDCAAAVGLILERGEAGEIYNVGSGEEKRNIEVVKKILSLLGKPEDLIQFTKDRSGHDYRYSLNSGKMGDRLNWTREISFERGIEKTVAWYIGNMAWLKTKQSDLARYWEQVYQ
jgi:dTDP-glucose 4,6-dehydratase